LEVSCRFSVAHVTATIQIFPCFLANILLVDWYGKEKGDCMCGPERE